ncbi:MAG TPA: DUF4097 domain-containing protein [Firmicutes bacterium]|nr:DUF4097 domain-containing protein [Bacillota bacterium]
MTRIRLGAPARAALMALALAPVLVVAGCAVGENNWAGGSGGGEVRSLKLSQEVPAGAFREMALQAGPGGVSVTAWEGKALGLEVETRASGGDPAAVEAYLEQFRLEVKTVGERVEASVRGPEETPAEVRPEGVWWLVKVPRGTKGVLNLRTDQAAVRLAGLTGEAKVALRRAALEVEDCTGSLTAEVTQGPVEVRRFEGTLTIKSDGPVRLSEVRLAGSGRVQTANAPLWLDLADLALGHYEFATANAPVRLALPYGAAARIRVATTNGRVCDELPLTWVDRNDTDLDGVYHFEGWLNAGGAECSVATTNGDVTLVYR